MHALQFLKQNVKKGDFIGVDTLMDVVGAKDMQVGFFSVLEKLFVVPSANDKLKKAGMFHCAK